AARFSPDGRYLAYAIAIARHLSIIRIAEVDSGKTHDVTRPVLWDSAPAWDPKGHYLYFLSTRTLDPVYDAVHFELGFYRADRPYAVALRADEGSPFVPEPKPLKEEKGQAKEDGSAEETPEAPLAGDGGETGEGTPESSAAAPLRIDFQGIADRVVAFPVPPARCVELAAIEGKVLWTTEPVRGALADGGGAGRRTLRGYDFEKQETLRLADGLVSFRVSADGSALAYRDGEQALRVIPAGEKAPEEDGCTRKGGWIDLSRLKISVDPPAEWRQMYREAWRLQRDQFWTEDLSGVDWQAVHDRYLPLLDRVGCRSEFSDLIWEMQGELGTSHAYEYGGDYRPSPAYAQGLLGADLRLEAGQWIIAAIPAGDVWDEAAASPLARPGVDARPGDVILRVAGVPVGADRSPASVLVNLAEEEVELTLKRGDDPPRTVTVRTLGDERPLRYRAWVEANRRLVHARSGGRVGYLHVPDMGPAGYAEFHRYFLVEADRDALVVDVRNNGGGHVSQLLLEKLARRRVGYDQPRWSEPVPYPEDSPAGPLVCVSDELAGSDGDIFTHCFKLLKLGPVVGKRTWGGVIGIAPRHQLVDGGVTTQPEYSFWFEDVGWAVENYGVDPDIEVDIAPQEWREGRDPQLERAVDEALTRLETAPPRRPAFGPRPRLAPPKLPRR
ncbi:MAG: peptidase, partial [Deltaproteobacteria bacterium]